jgi:Fe-S cluster biogenesis protein NfuA
MNTTIKKIQKVLDGIRPSLQMDGGDIDLVEFDEKSGELKVALSGHCAHCAMAHMTLESIEEEIKKEVSEVKSVKNG